MPSKLVLYPCTPSGEPSLHEWAEGHEIHLGRDDSALDLGSSRRLARVDALVIFAAAGVWWVLNPHRKGDADKAALQVISSDAATHASVHEGGSTVLPPGEGTIIVQLEDGSVEIPYRNDRPIPDGVLERLGRPAASSSVIPTATAYWRHRDDDPDAGTGPTFPVRPDPVAAEAAALRTWSERHGQGRPLKWNEIDQILGIPEDRARSRLRQYRTKAEENGLLEMPKDLDALCRRLADNNFLDAVDDRVRDRLRAWEGLNR